LLFRRTVRKIAKKRVDNRRQSAKFTPTMKSDASNGILTVVLGALLVLGVYFALKVVFITHQLRNLQSQATRDQTILIQTQAIINDAIAYNQTRRDPELARILQPFEKPATR
jgi:hypothetical protein